MIVPFRVGISALTAFQDVQHRRHFVDEGGGEADVPVALVGAVPAGQSDLGAHGAAGRRPM